MVRESKQKARKTLAIGQDEISCLLIRMKETGNAERTALRLEHDYPDRKALVVSQLVRANAGALSVPLKGIAVLFSIQWAVSLFLIGVVHTFSIGGRRAELGIQKALGATDGNVRGMLLAEVALLSGVASLAGLGAGSLLVRAVAGHVRQAVDISLQLPGCPAVVTRIEHVVPALHLPSPRALDHQVTALEELLTRRVRLPGAVGPQEPDSRRSRQASACWSRCR